MRAVAGAVRLLSTIRIEGLMWKGGVSVLKNGELGMEGGCG